MVDGVQDGVCVRWCVAKKEQPKIRCRAQLGTYAPTHPERNRAAPLSYRCRFSFFFFVVGWVLVLGWVGGKGGGGVCAALLLSPVVLISSREKGV